MTQALRDAIDRYARAHADAAGIAGTPVPGMSLVRSVTAGELRHAIDRPLVCLVVQGAKQVTTPSRSLAFGAGDCMLLTADAPTVSRIVRAAPDTPYLSFALNLDAAVIAGLTAEMDAVAPEEGPALRLQPTNAEVADAALRLVSLLDRPATVPVLQAQLVRELHYWLLAGEHGPAMRRLALPDSRSRRIARAVEIIRSDFAAPLSVAQLASAAGMSASSFHHHFRAVTALSPLQFQKQLRLIEARRLMLARGLRPGVAAHRVGYASVSQFTREYRRHFGQPPARETRQARQALSTAERPGGDAATRPKSTASS